MHRHSASLQEWMNETKLGESITKKLQEKAEILDNLYGTWVQELGEDKAVLLMHGYSPQMVLEMSVNEVDAEITEIPDNY